jgi:PKD repeat protein
VICTKPVGGFKASSLNKILSITDSSTGASTISWSWGDGTAAGTGTSPAHTHSKDSTYKVCRYASNVCGADTTCKNILIKTLGIGHHTDFKISIFPNPAVGSFVIDIDKASVDMNYTIYTLDGRLMSKGELSQTISKIDITSLPKNTYMIQVMEKGKVVYKSQMTIEN